MNNSRPPALDPATSARVTRVGVVVLVTAGFNDNDVHELAERLNENQALLKLLRGAQQFKNVRVLHW